VELERPPEEPALGRLGQIAVPTLIVVGEQDIPDVHAHSGALEAGIRGATRVVLPGSGHLPHLEVSDAFNRIVLEFLA
jgi:pimeloyl-ACP methyl ester carboxylesterase